MYTKKAVVSFADALLSADAEGDSKPKVKKVKPNKYAKSKYQTDILLHRKSECQTSYPQHSSDTSNKKYRESTKLKDYERKGHSQKYKKTTDRESGGAGGVCNSSTNIESSKLSNNVCKNQTYDVNSEKSKWTIEDFDDHSDTDDSEVCNRQKVHKAYSSDSLSCNDERKNTVTPSTSTNTRSGSRTARNNNIRNKSNPTNKLLAKLLADEEAREQNTKKLESVDEELQLFDLQLEDHVEVEPENNRQGKAPLLPPGLPFLHSLTCHRLYSLDMVVWPFCASGTKCEDGSWGRGSIVAGTLTWLSGLDNAAIQDTLRSRLLQDSELGMAVIVPLFRYLVRYLACPKTTNNSGPSNNDSSSSSEAYNMEMTLACYQLLCYHIATTASPSNLLLPCIEELPLAMVNVGCDSRCFPAGSLQKWRVQDSTYHRHTPNSAADSILQLHALQLLLSVLSNCLARVVAVSGGGGDGGGGTTEQGPNCGGVSEESLDDLVVWLLLLGQDPCVISSSLHVSVASAVSHALDLYDNFPNKIQELVERISAAWLDWAPCEGSESNGPEGSEDVKRSIYCLDGYPHHTASYLCSTLLCGTRRAAMLSASLAFLSLSACLHCHEYEVLDYVEMRDVVNVLSQQRDVLLAECDSYRLRSVLLLLDNCVTHTFLTSPTPANRRDLQLVSDFVRVELVRCMHGSSDGGAGDGNATVAISMNKAQLQGLRTAVLQRWERIMSGAGSVYTPDGLRVVGGHQGSEAMDVDSPKKFPPDAGATDMAPLPSPCP